MYMAADGTAFNSLFEMPNKSCMAIDLFTCSSFNSLFEMPVVADPLEFWYAHYEAFNSLFEMH